MDELDDGTVVEGDTSDEEEGVSPGDRRGRDTGDEEEAGSPRDIRGGDNGVEEEGGSPGDRGGGDCSLSFRPATVSNTLLSSNSSLTEPKMSSYTTFSEHFNN